MNCSNQMNTIQHNNLTNQRWSAVKVGLATAIGCDMTVMPVLSGLGSEWSVQKHFGDFRNVFRTGSVFCLVGDETGLDFNFKIYRMYQDCARLFFRS